MSALTDMQTRGAGIGGPIAKPRFMSFPRALNRLKPSNSAPPASICSPIKRVRGSSPHCSTNQSPHGGDFPGAAPNTHVLAPSRPVDLVSGFSHSVSTDVMAVLSLHPEITFPRKRRPT
jgi:hypothetical protein